MILLNKVDLVHPENSEARHRHVMRVSRLVRKLNAEAKIMVPGYEFEEPSSNSVVGKLTVSKFEDFDVKKVVNTSLFDMKKAQMSAGWIREWQNEVSGVGHTPETEEYGIGSFVWRTSPADPRPFHPERLAAVLHGFGNMKTDDTAKDPFTSVVRSKGQFWFANFHSIPVEFQSAGKHLNMECTMPFLAAVPRKYWDIGAYMQYEQYLTSGRWHGGR